MPNPDRNQVLADQKYILLETYKNNGEAKGTPVWFRLDGGLVYFHTGKDTWKAKRLRRNPRVRLAPCTFGGEVKGEWISGEASMVGEGEAGRMIKLINSRYGIMGRVMRHTERNRLVYAIRLDPPSRE